jgi:hypothetical protein
VISITTLNFVLNSRDSRTTIAWKTVPDHHHVSSKYEEFSIQREVQSPATNL